MGTSPRVPVAPVPGQHLLVPARRRPAIASGPEYPHVTPATSTDTSELSVRRIPRFFRGSVSRAASTSRSDAGFGGTPAAPRWQRTTLHQR